MNSKLLILCKIVSAISVKKFSSLPELFRQAKSSKIPTAKVYEAILQCYLFNGFPAAITALNQFTKIYNYKTKKNYEQFNTDKFMLRGKRNIGIVYGDRTAKLLKKFATISPDLKDWMIIEGYGKVKGRKNLNLKDRELLNVSILCSNFYKEQLISHIQGSINTGNSINDIRRAIESTTEYNSKTNLKMALRLLTTFKKVLLVCYIIYIM